MTSRPGPRMTAPLSILAVLAIAGGVVQTPATGSGTSDLFAGFMDRALPPLPLAPEREASEGLVGSAAMAVSLLGIGVAWFCYIARPSLTAALAARTVSLRAFLLSGLGFDALYDLLVVRPFLWAARASRPDYLDGFFRACARLAGFVNGALSSTQTGRVRWYALGITAGAIVIVAIVVLS